MQPETRTRKTYFLRVICIPFPSVAYIGQPTKNRTWTFCSQNRRDTISPQEVTSNTFQSVGYCLVATQNSQSTLVQMCHLLYRYTFYERIFSQPNLLSYPNSPKISITLILVNGGSWNFTVSYHLTVQALYLPLSFLYFYLVVLYD